MPGDNRERARSQSQNFLDFLPVVAKSPSTFAFFELWLPCADRFNVAVTTKATATLRTQGIISAEHGNNSSAAPEPWCPAGLPLRFASGYDLQ